ncbi:CobW family GTP-binding protein [Bacillus sp. FJAT-45037]|uniref:CobW family GTP-binding protein n=1 Tax=Bacillus sp. FJAT-45037 TaxID=2011007 RepID=UPI000C2325BD|nr:GTP-binding protein [Bacillus sp. FJAT-45037]
MNNPIPAYVLTGFLGSGKTTVLRRMIQTAKEEGLRPVIVMNELGEVNVERHLFEDVDMVEMLNGCICCTIQEDMRSELERFFEQENSGGDILFIEGTGIANPEEIVEALTHPNLVEKVQLQSVISLIDASKYLEYQSRFQSSKEVRELLGQQVTSSSLLILNKMDLVSERELAKLYKKLHSIKREEIPILEAINGQVDVGELFLERVDWNKVTLNESAHIEKEHHHHHHHTFQAIRIDGIEKIDRIKFEKWLKQHDQQIIRAKGNITLTESPKKYSFQYASKQLQLSAAASEDELIIILIGIGLDKEELVHSLHSFSHSSHSTI